MRPFWIFAVGAMALTCTFADRASAQEQQYETPRYTTPPSTLDKNYGLPTFGMPGSELPQQKTMATKPPDAPPEPPSMVSEFFKTTPEATIARPPRAVGVDRGMETPRYTTSYGRDDTTTFGTTTGSDTTFGTTADPNFGTGSRFGTAAMEAETGR